MLRASIGFFVLGIISILLGMNNIAGLSIEIGKILLVVFLILSIISFFVGRGKKNSLLVFALILSPAGSFSFIPNSMADDSVIETAKEVGNDTKRATKKSVRTIKDKTCGMINGKVECAVQEAKHAVLNTADKAEDAID